MGSDCAYPHVWREDFRIVDRNRIGRFQTDQAEDPVNRNGEYAKHRRRLNLMGVQRLQWLTSNTFGLLNWATLLRFLQGECVISSVKSDYVAL
jgi:hypothetical protein